MTASADALRLLCANLCLVSRPGCVRQSVPLGLAGILLGVLLLAFCAPLRGVFAHPGWLCWALALYVSAGVQRCRGALPAAFLSFAAAADLLWGPGCLLALVGLLGFVFLAVAPLGQLVACALRLVGSPVLFDAQEERVSLLCSLLENYDVLCFQEVTVFWGLDDIARAIRDAAMKRGLAHFCSSGRWPAWPSTFATSGLCIVSRHPIARFESFSFSRQSWFEWSFVQRGCLMAWLEAPSGRTIAVANLHTTAGVKVIESGVGHRRETDPANNIGLRQVLEALDRFALFSKGADHKILCGDFNIAKDSPAFVRIAARAKELGLSDCFAGSPPTFGCSDEPVERLLTKPADRGVPVAIDHVFSDRSCAAARIEPFAAPKERWESFQQVSDHRGLDIAWE